MNRVESYLFAPTVDYLDEEARCRSCPQNIHAPQMTCNRLPVSMLIHNIMPFGGHHDHHFSSSHFKHNSQHTLYTHIQYIGPLMISRRSSIYKITASFSACTTQSPHSYICRYRYMYSKLRIGTEERRVIKINKIIMATAWNAFPRQRPALPPLQW